MPTPAEQRALGFVALVVLLGAAARLVASGSADMPRASGTEQEALARQAFAANSSSAAGARKKGSRGRDAARAAPSRRDDVAISVATGGFPPPGPRIDIGGAMAPVGVAALAPAGPPLVDLDVAGAAEIERLPWVGPALARRIVASRDSLGPFGILPALGRVKGVGPATLRRLAPLVTFSGQARR
jgi:competence protein ComEA